MALTEKQIAVLTALAQSEQELGILSRGFVDARHADEPVIAAMERRISELKTARAAAHKSDVINSIEHELASLRKQLERRRATNDQRNDAAAAHLAVAASITRTIDGVLAHAGSTRRELGLDYWRTDPAPTALLGMR